MLGRRGGRWAGEGALVAVIAGGVYCMRTLIEYFQPARCRRAISFLFQNAESARNSFGDPSRRRA